MACCKTFEQAVAHGGRPDAELPIRELFGDYWLTSPNEDPFIQFCPWCGVKIGSIEWHSRAAAKAAEE